MAKKELFDDAPQALKAQAPQLSSEHYHRRSDHELVYDPMCQKCHADDQARKLAPTLSKEDFERTLFLVPREDPEHSICVDYVTFRYPPREYGEGLAKDYVRYDKLGQHKDLQIVIIRRVHDDFGHLPSAFREIPNATPGAPPTLRRRPHQELFPEVLESQPIQIAEYMDFGKTALYARESDKTGPHRLAQALQDIAGVHYRIEVPSVVNLEDQKLIFRCS